MARQLIHPAHHMHQRPDAAIGGIETASGEPPVLQRVGGLRCLLVVRLPRKPVGDVGGETEHPGRIPHRGLTPIGDGLTDHPRTSAPVLLIDVLEHVLPLLVLDVEVDVWRAAPLLRQEALEQKLELDGVHRGDAQAVTDAGVGR